MHVGVIGCGSIGSVLARGFDQLGHTIHINDIDPDRTDALPYPSRDKQALAQACDIIIIATPTPTTSQGGDASTVDAALTPLHDTDATIIIRSTMPPGTTRRLSDSHDLPLVYSPEFLRDRSTVTDFFQPDRIVLAGPQPQRDHARRLVDTREIKCDTFIECDDYLPAELGKEAHNAFFATKVTFANQLRLLCEPEGVDPQTVVDIVTADHRNTASHLDPLLGPYGGKCLPKDTEALAKYGEHLGVPVDLLDAVIELNETARERYEDVDIDGEWPDIRVEGA